MNFENDEGIRDLFKIFKKLKKGCTLKNINHVIKCACPLLEACKYVFLKMSKLSIKIECDSGRPQKLPTIL